MATLGNKVEKIIITGSCGFIGMHLCESLLRDGYVVHGIDNMNDYYNINLKMARLKRIKEYNNFKFSKIDIADDLLLESVFKNFKPDIVVNLAGQAGVRYSLEKPHSYIQSNIVGFMNILECCNNFSVKHLVYASSSSVYGENKNQSFSVNDRTDMPLSIYAASKKANELMAYSYGKLYGLSTIGLRYFSVYGPWGRPDMAMFIFTKSILEEKPILLYNFGNMERDFTFIDDIIEGTRLAINNKSSHKLFNLGNNHSVDLMTIIGLLETKLGKKAKILFKNIQKGDTRRTNADISESIELLGYKPKVKIKDGLSKFVDWYKEYNDTI